MPGFKQTNRINMLLESNTKARGLGMQLEPIVSSTPKSKPTKVL